MGPCLDGLGRSVWQCDCVFRAMEAMTLGSAEAILGKFNLGGFFVCWVHVCMREERVFVLVMVDVVLLSSSI